MIEAGDVVEAVHEMLPLRQPTHINKGFRTIVVAVTQLTGHCDNCDRDGPGLILADLPLPPERAWCVNHWRKIGGREVTAKEFAEDLNITMPLLDHEPVT